MAKLTLVSHFLCPYVQRAVIALKEKGAAFDRIYIDLDQKPDWFNEISPLGKVPLLLIEQPGQDKAVLFESSVICEFIEETQPGRGLHPDGAFDRARHRAWVEFGSSILGDIYAIETTPDAVVFAAKQRALDGKFTRMEAAIGDGPYFAGAEFSLVDAAFASVFRYFDVFDRIGDFGILSGKPKVAEWRRALAERPSVITAVTDDYETRLWQFLECRTSHLRALMGERDEFGPAVAASKLAAVGG